MAVITGEDVASNNAAENGANGFTSEKKGAITATGVTAITNSDAIPLQQPAEFGMEPSAKPSSNDGILSTTPKVSFKYPVTMAESISMVEIDSVVALSSIKTNYEDSTEVVISSTIESIGLNVNQPQIRQQLLPSLKPQKN